MHLPDGILTERAFVPLAVASAVAIGVASRSTSRELLDRGPAKVPLMGLMGAFILAAQMVNFPIPGTPVSWHLLGGVLAAVLLGPAAATLVMACVFIVQALLFADGGLLALGANIWNGGVIATTVGYAVYRVVERVAAPLVGARAAPRIGAFAGAFLAVALGALACGLEIVASQPELGRGELVTGLVVLHLFIGLAEGVITVAVLSYLAAIRPDLVPGAAPPPPQGPGAVPAPVPVGRRRGVALALRLGAAVALVAIVVLYFASDLPDALEATLARFGLGSAEP